MKAFVIKNKEGKYYQDKYYMPAFTDDLFTANKYQSIEETKKILNKSLTLVDSFEPVEVTIAEGDLEQENKQLKEQNERVLEKLELIVSSNQDLEHELEVYEKALKLACKSFVSDEISGLLTNEEIYDYFIEQAKESMK